MNLYPHLDSATAEIAQLDNAARIYHTQKDRWIQYPEADRVYQELVDLMNAPQSDRMPNMLLVGNTNNGKTSLVKEFCRRHPPIIDPNGERMHVPVLYEQMPPRGDDRALYAELLNTLYKPHPNSENVDAKRTRLANVLRDVGLRVLIIDEFQHVLAGSYQRQRNSLNAVKYLSNELGISIVAVGTKEAAYLLNSDPQLANRFIPQQLPIWKLDKTYLQLLMTIEKMLPLRKASNLKDRSIAERVFMLSEGIFGEMSSLLNRAAIYAIRKGTEQITLEAIENCGFIKPSKRRDQMRDAA